mmetsp:Transcript_45084/g.72462  ORF Transcript_45084/g.72462 Transcript_45084/m.72462 type:complete len:147 (+) Transcript_45084:670-1110(+)
MNYLRHNICPSSVQQVGIKVNISANSLPHLVRYIKAHGLKQVPSDKCPKPCPSTKLSDFWPCSWDSEFVEQLEQSTLFDLIQAANFLDMKPLLELLCAQVACMIKGTAQRRIETHIHTQREETTRFRRMPHPPQLIEATWMHFPAR